MFSKRILSHAARLHLARTAPAIARRTFASTSISRAGDTPTHFTNILAGANVPAVQVKNVGPDGIQLDDGLIIPSACLFIEGKVFLWNVPPAPWEGWKPEHFEVFDTIVPKPGEPTISYTIVLQMTLLPILRAFVARNGKATCTTSTTPSAVPEQDWHSSGHDGHGMSL